MPRLRFSLRWLFGVVSCAAVGCASLAYATPFGSKLVLTCTLAVLVAAGVAALVHRGPRRAFWAGFAIVGVAYLWLVCGSWQTPHGHPLRDWLLTTAVLDWCHGKMPHTRSIPPISPSSPPGMFSALGGGSMMPGGSAYGPMTGAMPAGIAGMPGGMAGGPPGVALTAPPDPGDFSIAGHSLFALLFAMLGGLFARRGYRAAEVPRA